MTLEHLHRRLADAADLGPEYGNGLASHLPMALGALHRLGADDAGLDRFFEVYCRDKRLLPVAAPGPDGADSPDSTDGPRLSAFGRIADFSAWRRRFEGELRVQGRDAVLRRLIPQLMPGVAGAAFHGLIRTAHAVDAGHEGELAAALAYWAARWLVLPAPISVSEADAERTPATADAWVRALADAPAVAPLSGRMIVDRAAQVAGDPAFQRWTGPLPPAADWPARWARAAVERFVATGNFTVLHLVTATHAWRVLQPWMGAEEQACADAFARAYAAAWLSARTDPAAPARADPGFDWPQILARARASDDDHVVKLVYSALEESRQHGGDAWRHAAALVVEQGS